MIINSIKIHKDGGWKGSDLILFNVTVFKGTDTVWQCSMNTDQIYYEWNLPPDTDTFELLEIPVNGSNIVVDVTSVGVPGTEIIIEAGKNTLKYEAAVQEDTQTFDIQLELLGDVNGDLKIDVTDALWIGQYIAGIREFDELQRRKADVDDDGVITANDAKHISLCLSHGTYDPLYDQYVCDLLGRPIAFYIPVPVKEAPPPPPETPPPPVQPPVKKKIPILPFAIGGAILGLIVLAKRRRK